MPLPSPSNLVFDIETLGVLLLVIAVIVLALWVMRLETRIARILGGNKNENIEQSLTELHRGHTDFRSFEQEMQAYLTSAESRLRKSIQRIETIRFNPFKGSGDGGNQSFATAFINEDGDGVIISSLYARDRMSIFTKPISTFTSSFELSDEERQVLEKVRKSMQQP